MTNLVLHYVFGPETAVFANYGLWVFLSIGAIALFAMGYVGLAISLWPNIVPHGISLWDAAAAPRSQAFLLLGTLFLLPVIVGYTAWSYWVFRGKVRAGTGYH